MPGKLLKPLKQIPPEVLRFSEAIYRARFEKTHREWQKFITHGTDIDPAVIPEEILKSWQRCRALGADPLNLPSHKILSEKSLEKLIDENREFIETGKNFLNHIYSFWMNSRYTVGLFDRQGCLLEVVADAESLKLSKKVDWRPGVLWDESCSGNTVVGTVIYLKKPVRIFGPQAYNQNFHPYTSFGAPVFDPQGELIGGVAMTAYYYGTTTHTFGMTVALAKAIENELKARGALRISQQAFADAEMASSLRNAVIGSIPDAVVAVDNEGRIYLINDKARKFFFKDEQIEGRHLRDVFGRGNRRFLRMVETTPYLTDREVRIHSKNGSGDYNLTSSPIVASNGAVIGSVLIFSEIKRIKTLVAKMIGAKADFRFEDICGSSASFLETLDHARLVARNSSNVLLLGESGTGKDIFAQAIHNASSRRDGPYVAINCAAIPRDLITSELFGYAEGAFTGSRRGGNQGKFELADGGTIFLDEIAEIPLELQTVLLRVIEDKSVVRIGSSRVRPVDVRIIAATNKDLPYEVGRGNFRKDLYYRLNVFSIRILPLKERPEDIPVLVEFFIDKFGNKSGKEIARIDDKVMDAFLKYSWPGNVRELQNVIERMINYARTDELTLDLVPPEIVATNGRLLGSGEELQSPAETERKLIARMLTLNFPKKQIARKINVSRTTLFRRMKKYGLG